MGRRARGAGRANARVRGRCWRATAHPCTVTPFGRIWKGGLHARAAEAFRKANDIDPQDPSSYDGLGLLAYDAGDLDTLADTEGRIAVIVPPTGKLDQAGRRLNRLLHV